jgi:glycosyltransferase involved in cell wall biosynthesis
MRILMASHYFASHKGGVEIVAEALFHAFSDNGQEVVWIAGNVTSPPEPRGNSRAVSLPVFNFVEDKIGLPFPIPTIGALRKIIREIRSVEILILHDCLYLSNIIAFLAARWRGIPIIIIQHTRYYPGGTHLLNAIMKIATAIVTHPMLLRAAQVIFIGKTTMESYAQLRLRSCPELIFNGVNTDLFHWRGDSQTVLAIRRKYCLPEDGTVILFVGRFVEKKGILVIKHMANLRSDWTWVLAGWGPLDPTRWNAANVQVFSSLDDPSIAELYRCCDLLVLPSSGEGGFPLVAREALASGIPVVCGEETLGADPAMAEFVTGVPVYPEDDDRTTREFLFAIDKAFDCGAKSDEKFEERKSFAVSQCSWHRATEQYLEIISRLIPQTTANASAEASVEKARR